MIIQSFQLMFFEKCCTLLGCNIKFFLTKCFKCLDYVQIRIDSMAKSEIFFPKTTVSQKKMVKIFVRRDNFRNSRKKMRALRGSRRFLKNNSNILEKVIFHHTCSLARHKSSAPGKLHQKINAQLRIIMRSCAKLRVIARNFIV